MEETNSSENIKQKLSWSDWYDKNYKILLAIPVVIMILSSLYLGYFISQHNDFLLKDASLSGGTTITILGDIDSKNLESSLKQEFPDISVRQLTDLRTGKALSTIIETSSQPEQIQLKLEEVLSYKLTEDNSSTEFTGPTLSNSFYKQLILALFISFILMSFVIFFLFRTFIPSIAVIFAAFSDIIMPLALIDFLGIRLSAAGIAAFLMLIGYSVDTDILLTTRVIKRKDGTVNNRIFGAFKTGIFMTSTAIIAVVPAFLFVSGLPDSFRQIFLILAFGLIADIFNTWLTNASIIKWYCDKHKIE